MPTYLDKILSILPTEPVSIEQIIEYLELPSTKKIHVIGGIKKGLDLGKIGMIQQPEVKTLYVGHLYFRRQ